MKLSGVVLKKEIIDNLRDRRTLAAALLYPFLGPAMILFMVYAVGQLSEDAEKPLSLPVVGSENAPNLVHFLEQNNVTLTEAPGDPEQAVRLGDERVVLVIPETFGDEFRESRPAPVRLIVDSSRNEASSAIARARSLLNAYSGQMGSLRLSVRGIDPRITEAVAVELFDVATPQSQGARILSMAPYFILVSLFVGGMYLAIDSTAGERERGSLEPLLINPVSRSELVLGKAGAVLLFTLVALIETLIGFSIILNYVPLENYIGVRMSLPFTALLNILLVSIPLMIFVVAVQLMVASYTKSFKEAQNYISLILLIPALPALIMAILPVEQTLWIAAIPTVGQQLFINQIMRAESLSPIHLALSSGVTLATGILLLWLVVKRYEREAILFR